MMTANGLLSRCSRLAMYRIAPSPVRVHLRLARNLGQTVSLRHIEQGASYPDGLYLR